MYSESELVLHIKARDKIAFDYLYKQYSAALMGVASRIHPKPEIAEEVLQESFMKIWKNIESYDPTKGRLFTWMLNITRNTAIDFTRLKNYNYSNHIDDKLVDTVDNETSSLNIDTLDLPEIIKNLNPEHLQVLQIIYFKGFTHSEAAEELGLPLGTIKTRLRAAITKLRLLYNHV